MTIICGKMLKWRIITPKRYILTPKTRMGGVFGGDLYFGAPYMRDEVSKRNFPKEKESRKLVFAQTTHVSSDQN